MEHSQPCRAATLNSSSGIESANFLANAASVTPSRGFAECFASMISASIGGGRYAWFCTPASLIVRPLSLLFTLSATVLAPTVEVVRQRTGRPSGNDGSGDNEPDDPDGLVGTEENVEGSEENSVELEDDAVEGDGGITGSSMLSRSPSMGASSSSVEGKKLRKSCSACHFDAFLNSIQTSMRPGRDSAGSRRSRWLVVLKVISVGAGTVRVRCEDLREQKPAF